VKATVGWFELTTTGVWSEMRMTEDLYEPRVRGNLSDPVLRKRGGSYEVKVRGDLSYQEVKAVIVVQSFALRGTDNWSGQEMKMTDDSSELKEGQMTDALSEMKIIDDWFGEKAVKGELSDHPEVKATEGWSAKKMVRGSWSALEMRFEMTSECD